MAARSFAIRYMKPLLGAGSFLALTALGVLHNRQGMCMMFWETWTLAAWKFNTQDRHAFWPQHGIGIGARTPDEDTSKSSVHT